MSDASADDGYTPVEMIYAGYRLSSKHEKLLVFYPIGSDQQVTFDAVKARKQFRYGIIGGVFRHMQKDELFRISNTYIRASDDPRIAEWTAANEACEVTLRALKRIAAAKADSKASIDTALAPFRREYAKTDRFGKLALEVVLLASLRHVRPGDIF